MSQFARPVFSWFVVVLIIIVGGVANAQPVNDECDTATNPQLLVGSNAHDSTGATDSATPLWSGCPGSVGGAMSADVFYFYQNDNIDAVSATVETCTSAFDTDIAVYELLSGQDCTTMTEIACSGDACPGFASQAIFNAEPFASSGIVYVIQIGEWSGGGIGWVGTVEVLEGPFIPPAIENLSCSTVSGSDIVDAAWTNPIVYGELNVYINGILEATLPGSVTSYSTPPQPPLSNVVVCIEGVVGGALGRQTCCFVNLDPDSTVSYLPISGDDDSGISDATTYTHALDFGNQPPGGGVATINGVVFEASGTGAFPPISPGSTQTVGTGTSNPGVVFDGDGAADPYLVDGGMRDLVHDFNWGAANAVIQLTGLTPETSYRVRLYHRSWGGTRPQDIGFDTDGVGTDITGAEQLAEFFEDDATQPEPSFSTPTQVYALTYDYDLSPGVTTLTVYVNSTGTGTYHLYGLTNEETTGAPVVRFARGDCNDDGGHDIADPVAALGALFVMGTMEPGCLDACDANDDGGFDISDPVTMLSFLFIIGTSPYPDPAHPICGEDPTDDTLDCLTQPTTACP